MAYVVARPDHRPNRTGPTRYEIRESISTPAGPRARTLATFRVLSERVVADAAARAQRRFDADKIWARAAALGAPRRSHEAAATAITLLGQLRAGESLPPVLVAELRRALPRGESGTLDSLESAAEWVGVDAAARGRALRELLDVASRVPVRPRPLQSSFPRLSSNGAS